MQRVQRLQQQKGIMWLRIYQRRAESPMERLAQGKRSDTLGFPHSRVSTPCKGKSFNPLCCYSYLIADLAILKWNIVCIFCSTATPCLKAFALTGRDCSNTRYPGCRFACPGLCAPLGFQPALAKSETWVTNFKNGSNYFFITKVAQGAMQR